MRPKTRSNDWPNSIRRAFFVAMAALCIAAALPVQAASNSTDKWTFVSFPDYFNFDVPNPKPEWEDAIDWQLDQIAAEDPVFCLVAGDLVNGHWWDGPRQIEHLGNVYYGGWMRRMRDHGLKVYAAIGDHELGDDPWPPKKAKLKPHFEDAFVAHLDPPRNGPEGFKGLAYYVRHRNVLVITVETFEEHDGKILPTVSGRQLQWVEETLSEHGPDADFIVVQGHAPILPGVKSRSSSRIMLKGGRDSEFWQVMKRHGVDLYLCGEHHDITCKEADGIWQIVHGGSWGRKVIPDTNYLRAHVGPDRMELALKEVPLICKGNNIWNIHKSRGPRDIVQISDEAKKKGFQTIGTVTIEKNANGKKFTNITGAFAEHQ